MYGVGCMDAADAGRRGAACMSCTGPLADAGRESKVLDMTAAIVGVECVG